MRRVFCPRLNVSSIVSQWKQLRSSSEEPNNNSRLSSFDTHFTFKRWRQMRLKPPSCGLPSQVTIDRLLGFFIKKTMDLQNFYFCLWRRTGTKFMNNLILAKKSKNAKRKIIQSPWIHSVWNFRSYLTKKAARWWWHWSKWPFLWKHWKEKAKATSILIVVNANTLLPPRKTMVNITPNGYASTSLKTLAPLVNHVLINHGFD